MGGGVIGLLFQTPQQSWLWLLQSSNCFTKGCGTTGSTEEQEKKIRHFFETPIRLRRYWYLTCRWEIRFELAWIGVPFRQYPQFKCGNTFLGLTLRKSTQLMSHVSLLLGLGRFVADARAFLSCLVKTIKRLWNDRPSAIQGFIDLFQPEAPVYVRRGYTITPARRPRLVNLVSDMEVFASRGSSLLVFMFLI